MPASTYTPAPRPADEAGRLRALAELDVLDSPPEEEFELLVALAADRFRAPTATVSLIAAERQWFKARVGLDACETARESSFCAHALLGDDLLVIPDAALDARFAGNPLVLGAPFIRFYLGAPLVTASGHKVGTLCVTDPAPRPGLDEVERRALRLLARQAMRQLEVRQMRTFGRVSQLVDQTTSDAFVCADARDRIIHWNGGAERLFGWSAAEAIGRGLALIVPPALRDAHRAGFARVRGGGKSKLSGKIVEVPALHRDGREIPIELSLAMWRDEVTGRPAGFAAIARDCSARKALEVERARAQALLDTVVEAMPAAVFVKEAGTGRFALVNRAFEELTQQGREAVLGRSDADFAAPEEAAAFAARDREVLRTGDMSVVEEPFTRPDGDARLLRTKKLGIDRGADGRPAYLLGISEDITATREAQARLRHLASHDGLTGLANRAAFAERLAAVAASSAGGAVLMIDLDRFKAVNDLHGHLAGDALLMAAAARLRGAGRGRELFAARLGGDEFAALLPGVDAAGAAAVAGRIVASLSAPYPLDGPVAHVGASLGIAVAPADGRDPTELLRNADLALYRAKDAGRGCFRFFEPEMDRAARERRRLEADLRAGLARGEVSLEYQPIASLATGRVVSFEALARWRHPTEGAIGPDLFIPIAEESGLIVELGRQVLHAAVAQAARWSPPLAVAVNLSPVQFLRGDFAGEVAGALADAGLAPERLELEITEGVLIRDADRALAILRELKRMGVRIAMDDFGTGYSSLSYFRQFPFDKVKIDQSFVRDMGANSQALAVVQAVIGLGRGLGMPVVAEGVETREQLDALRAEGCAQVQGYAIGRPAPIEAFAGAVLDHRVGEETAARTA